MTDDRRPPPAPARSALVVTVVHHPEDARIRHREIAALLAAGWSVTYAAPFAAHGLDGTATPQESAEGLTRVDLPRATGRDRLPAGRAARALLRARAAEHDVVLVHDPELLVAAAGLALDHLVWDVHEDPAGALAVKDWLPAPLRRPVAGGWRRVERVAERRHHLLLAEHAYADRFAGSHPVVPNAVLVPEHVPDAGSGSDAHSGDRVVHVGNLTVARGSELMLAVARLVAAGSGGSLTLDVVGPARDERSRRAMEQGGDEGVLRWHGFLPSQDALALVDGALAGLSLLADLPNYRGSMPTKVLEYLAHGVPAVTTPLPVAVELVEASGGGLVVPFDDAASAAAAVLDLHRDPARAATMGRAGRELVRRRYDWASGGPDFVAALEAVAASRES